MADSPTQQRDPKGEDVGRLFPHSFNVETLSGDKTISNSDEQYHMLDANGSPRTVTLPSDEEGLVYAIANESSSANALTVEDSDNNTVVTVNKNEAAILVNHGGGWFAVAGGSGPTQNQ